MPIGVSGTVTLLQVFDMATSLRFYRDLLGFEVIGRSDPSDDCGGHGSASGTPRSC